MWANGWHVPVDHVSLVLATSRTFAFHIGSGTNLKPATCELLRKLAALPALVEAYGWPRRLAVPPMAQLGYYPGGSGAYYKPHLDRQPGEVNNRRELTFLVYVNCDWCVTAHYFAGHAQVFRPRMRVKNETGDVDSKLVGLCSCS